MPPRAWRPGFEPAELSFRVPYFFHQARRGIRRVLILYDTPFSGNQKFADLNGACTRTGSNRQPCDPKSHTLSN
jgi:hypothetical protein